MQKKMLVTVEIVVEEEVEAAEIRENIINLDYLSETPVRVVNIEMNGWITK